MPGFLKRNKAVDIKRDFYCMESDGTSGTITLYGEIVEQKPRHYWTDEEIEGNYIVKDEFIKDLESLRKCRDITIYIDSAGGDAPVAVFIHNKLRELARKGAKLTCVVDGVAMSGGSLIMCACDTVKANPSSLIMIHKCWSYMFGGYNADELRKAAEQDDAYDKAQAEIYMKKTGLGEEEIMSMMGETTYMTGAEAMEKGFVDELTEGSELKISASANGTSIFCKGHELRMFPGEFAPDFIPTISSGEDPAEDKNTNAAYAASKEGGNLMTVEELRTQYPDLVAEIETQAQAAVPNDEAVKAAVEGERARIRDIQAIAAQYDDQLVREAMYGETACSAMELAYRGALAQSERGASFLAGLRDDVNASGTKDVGMAPPPEKEGEGTPAQKKAEAKATVRALLGKEEE